MANEEPIEGELINDDHALVLSSAQALEAINRTEIDMQVATARKFPRSITEFRRKTMEIACIDAEIAGTMFYALPRGGKKLRGPSIRLAEVAAMAYRNLRYGARVVEITETTIVAQGFCMDMENNTGCTVECRRRITDKSGNRFNEDMMVVTGNAACSIALRNAIFKVLPFALVKPVYEQAMKVSAGDAGSVGANRKQWLETFGKIGVKPEQIYALLEIKGEADLTLEHMIELRGVYNSIDTGESSVEQMFGTAPVAGGRAKKSDLNEKIGGETKAADKPKEETKPAESKPAGGMSEALRGFDVMISECASVEDLRGLFRDIRDSERLTEDERSQAIAWCTEKSTKLEAKSKKGGELFENPPQSASEAGH